MKIVPFILLSIWLMACNSESPTDSGSENTVLLKASGLTGSVTLFESISKTDYEITSDGNYDLNLPLNQTVYNLEIVVTDQQACTINQQLDLVCGSIVCTADYRPVCAKKPLAGVVCITAPCQTDRYLTYGNSCGAQAENAWISIQSECGGLEDVIAFHQKPVVITNIGLLDIISESFQINRVDILDDALTLEFEVSGGCGSHDFTLYADEVFQESDPVQLSYIIAYTASDECDNIITIEKEFDLLPVKEIYRRAYPDATGEQSVNLNDLGIYQFSID